VPNGRATRTRATVRRKLQRQQRRQRLTVRLFERSSARPIVVAITVSRSSASVLRIRLRPAKLSEPETIRRKKRRRRRERQMLFVPVQEKIHARVAPTALRSPDTSADVAYSHNSDFSHPARVQRREHRTGGPSRTWNLFIAAGGVEPRVDPALATVRWLLWSLDARCGVSCNDSSRRFRAARLLASRAPARIASPPTLTRIRIAQSQSHRTNVTFRRPGTGRKGTCTSREGSAALNAPRYSSKQRAQAFSTLRQRLVIILASPQRAVRHAPQRVSAAGSPRG